MSKIILSGYILVADKDLSAVLNELPTHSMLTRAEAGCLVFEVKREMERGVQKKVQQDAQHKNKFSVYEEFIDQQVFDFHQQRVRDSNWGKITQSVERFYSIQTVDEAV